MNPHPPADNYTEVIERGIVAFLEDGREAGAQALAPIGGLVWSERVRRAALMPDARVMEVAPVTGSRVFTKARAGATYQRDARRRAVLGPRSRCGRDPIRPRVPVTRSTRAGRGTDVHTKMLVTATLAATALMSPAAALASGGTSGSGKNSTSSSTSSAPAECASITNATTTQAPQYNMVTGELDPYNLWVVTEHALARNCGTQTASLVWDISWTNTTTGVVEYPGVYNIPASVAPGASLDMQVQDGVTGTVPGKSYRFDLSVKSGTTGKLLAQQSQYYTIR